MRFFLYLSYKGTAYNGWQVQPGTPTVQGELNRALSTLLRKETETTGAGRTDTGVHASSFAAHFDTPDELPGGADDFLYHLNCILPKDIAASSVKRVEESAHARFDATLREYRYYVSFEKDPFRNELAAYCPTGLDISRMNSAAAILCDYDDFTSFCKLHSDNKTNICRVSASHWEQMPAGAVYTIAADRFLRNMVRAVVGTLMDVGRGKMDNEDFIRVIEARSRGAAGSSAPAQGLFLNRIEYPANIFLN